MDCQGPKEWTPTERIAHREWVRLYDEGSRNLKLRCELHGIVLAASQRTMPRYPPPINLRSYTPAQIERTVHLALAA